MNILLLSLYFPPLETIAAQRAFSFYNYLMSQGHNVSVITRYYDDVQIKGKDMLLGQQDARGGPNEFDKSLVYKNVYYTTFVSNSNEKRLFEKLPNGLKGLYNFYKTDVYHSGWIDSLNKALDIILKENKIDIVIGTYGPPIILRVAEVAAKKCEAKMVLDFRDSFIDERDTGLKLAIKKMVQNRHLANANGLIFATKSMETFFRTKIKTSRKLANVPSICVYNGVESRKPVKRLEDDIVINHFNQLTQENKLVLLHTGTLYDGQNINFFIQGLNSYPRKNDVKLVFLGLAKNGESELSKLSQIVLLEKVSIETSILLQKRASALVLPIWNGRYTGFSGKFVEYLNSGTPVITSPNPQEDLQEFFNYSGNVYISSDELKLHKILDDLLEGKIKAKSPLHPEYFQREYWLKKMGEFLEKVYVS